jgi:hypothetical protein
MMFYDHDKVISVYSVEEIIIFKLFLDFIKDMFQIYVKRAGETGEP